LTVHPSQYIDARCTALLTGRPARFHAPARARGVPRRLG
jgi:hypothetical protein